MGFCTDQFPGEHCDCSKFALAGLVTRDWREPRDARLDRRVIAVLDVHSGSPLPASLSTVPRFVTHWQHIAVLSDFDLAWRDRRYEAL